MTSSITTTTTPSYDGYSDNAKIILNATKGNSKLGLAHFTAMADLFNSNSNPNGYISLGIAENILSYDVLKEKLVLPNNGLPPQSLTQYSEIGGMPECRELISQLLQNQIFKFKPENKELLVKKEQILISGGATPLLENLFQLFCNRGEVCIIPSPLYPSFINDAYSRFGVKIVAAKTEVFDHQDDSNNNSNNNNNNSKVKDFILDLNVFEEIYNKEKVKMVLLCNPNNPNGFIFPSDQVEKLINWCREKKIHFISDEIYALSVFDKPTEASSTTGSSNNSIVKINEFVSSYDICKGDMGEYVHYLNGFSKDFCLNGFRAGYFYSQNKDVFRYMVSTSAFYSCSNLVQYTLINILKDKQFLENYINENQKRLKDAYQYATNLLTQYGIPFISSSSGVFLTLDLRSCLSAFPEPNKELDGDNFDLFSQEIKLWDEIFENRVVLNPGKLCYFQKPGFYRFIFTLPKDFVAEGIKRISKVYHDNISKISK